MRTTSIIPGLLATLLIHADAAEFTIIKDGSRILAPAVNEASGLAISPADPNLMWIINDSGGTTDLHLLETNGTDRGTVNMTQSKNIDWEDLASFKLDGKSHLLIADTGDNGAIRKTCTLYILREPALPSVGKKLATTATSSWVIDFSYEGGPRDCEAVAVDAVSETVILVSKRTNPPEIYQLPLRTPKKSEVLIAKKIGQTSVKSPTGTLLPFSNQPVALDITSDRSAAAILTYFGVFVFSRLPNQSWADAFSSKPTALAPHEIGQAESLAYSKDGKTIFVTAEGKASPVIRYTSP